jgi:cellulose synthase/poly-beta-1,6-N-acetylglucosamine synthase-like glycosyltransferase
MYFIVNLFNDFIYILISLLSALFSLRLIIMFLIKKFKELKNKNNALYSIKTYEVDKKTYPFFSILIPARNEADVIEKTLQNLLELNYSADRYEIIVIVDAKESFEKKPSTKEKVLEFIRVSSPKSLTKIKCFEIPVDFDGKLNGKKLHRFVPSTKGRALNYGLTLLEEKDDTHYCSFFDAESHPDKNILLHLRENIHKYGANKVYQGPLFQVRNFWKISYFSKVVALSQAFSHEYGLPFILSFIPFLGGTNMHIPLKLLKKIGGFSSSNSTEDLDLGVRCELDGGVKPVFIDIPSSEQTPPSIKGFIRQRFRWGSGACEVLDKLKERLYSVTDSTKFKEIKKLRLKLSIYGPAEWIAYFVLAIFIAKTYLEKLSFCIYTLLKLTTFPKVYSADIIMTAIGHILTLSAIMCGIFILLLYFKYSQFINDAWLPKNILKLSLLFLYVVFIIPFLVWIFSLPFISSFVLHLIGFREREWVKTERTAEI